MEAQMKRARSSVQSHVAKIATDQTGATVVKTWGAPQPLSKETGRLHVNMAVAMAHGRLGSLLLGPASGHR